jgi:hypothetical protein
MIMFVLIALALPYSFKGWKRIVLLILLLVTVTLTFRFGIVAISHNGWAFNSITFDYFIIQSVYISKSVKEVNLIFFICFSLGLFMRFFFQIYFRWWCCVKMLPLAEVCFGNWSLKLQWFCGIDSLYIVQTILDSQPSFRTLVMSLFYCRSCYLIDCWSEIWNR